MIPEEIPDSMRAMRPRYYDTEQLKIKLTQKIKASFRVEDFAAAAQNDNVVEINEPERKS